MGTRLLFREAAVLLVGVALAGTSCLGDFPEFRYAPGDAVAGTGERDAAAPGDGTAGSGTVRPDLGSMHGGEGTCLDAFVCNLGCGEDQACVSECVMSATAEAQPRLLSLDDCLARTCAQQPLNACLWDAAGTGDCRDEYRACVPAGEKGCHQIGPCAGSCETLECSWACIAQGSEEAQAAFMALVDCLFSACQDMSADCQGAAMEPGGACADKVAACLPDCADQDQDGYGVGVDCRGPDCNDNDPNINPGKLERCSNGRDDDCDGHVDEADACPPNCADQDQDGYGVGADCNDPDCDDLNPNVHRATPEVCDGLDNDCDGEIDEGDSCPVLMDPRAGLVWQRAAPDHEIEWDEATRYCRDLGLAGGGWRLPTIRELRSLIRGCPATEVGGGCNVQDGGCMSEGCLDDACYGCSDGGGPSNGCYWPNELQGVCRWYWSASPVAGDAGAAWRVYFNNGGVDVPGPGLHYGVRCVR